MMTSDNTRNLRRSSVMPGKGQLYKKPMAKKKMMQDPYAEGQSFKTIVPKPKPKPARPQTVNRAGKGSMMKRKMK